MMLTMPTWSTWLAITAIASIAFRYFHAPHPDTGAAELQIRNKLALYALAVDTKELGLLDEVFTTDAVFNYPDIGLLHGVAALQTYINEVVRGLVTQHTISTMVVDFGPPGQQHAPNSTAYLVANFPGQRNLTGQLLVILGKYTDQWAFEAGSWKSKDRKLTFLVRF